MAVKKTISLQDYVLNAAEQKSRELFGGSLSNYLSFLICNDNKEKIDKALEEIELSKPKRISEPKQAQFDSKCPYCTKKIKAGDTIYDVVLVNGLERYVHKNCSRE
jgi:ABC-type dipeptide/oligopeptide/nickel transport system ATPase component